MTATPAAARHNVLHTFMILGAPSAKGHFMSGIDGSPTFFHIFAARQRQTAPKRAVSEFQMST